MEIYYQPELSNGKTYLSEEESRHCVKVLRRSVGDKIVIVDGKGLRATAEIVKPNPKKCHFAIIEQFQETNNGEISHIAIAPTKNQDRIEWFVEKSIEIGVQKIDLYFSQNSERRKVNLERLNKKAISAMKQSGQSLLAQITIYKDFRTMLQASSNIQQKFIGYVDFNNPVHLLDIVKKSIPAIVLIGPEGDFTQDELNMALNSGYRKVSLGDNRLRTETAGLAACHILNLVNR